MKNKKLESFNPSLFRIIFEFKNLEKYETETLTEHVLSFYKSDDIKIQFSMNVTNTSIPIYNILDKIKNKKGNIYVTCHNKSGTPILIRRFKVKYVSGHNKLLDSLGQDNTTTPDFYGIFKEVRFVI